LVFQLIREISEWADPDLLEGIRLPEKTGLGVIINEWLE
jgi:hypothetical protein